MKKILIIAAVVAMFAMVFTACGKDEDSGGAASQPELTLVYDNAVNTPTATTSALNALIVTWTGAGGYDYEVYFEQRDPDGIIKPISDDTAVKIKGQTLYALKAKTGDSGPVSPWWELDNIDAAEKDLWSIALSSVSNGHYYYDVRSGTTPTNTALNTLFSTIAGEVKMAVGTNSSTPRQVYYRVGVAAANPGGYPIAEKRTVVYSEWF